VKKTILTYGGEPEGIITHINVGSHGIDKFMHCIGTGGTCESFNKGLQQLGLDSLGVDMAHSLLLRYALRWNLAKGEKLGIAMLRGVTNLQLVNKIIVARQSLVTRGLVAEAPHPLKGVSAVQPPTSKAYFSGFGQFDPAAPSIVSLRMSVAGLNLVEARKQLILADEALQRLVEERADQMLRGGDDPQVDIVTRPFRTQVEYALLKALTDNEGLKKPRTDFFRDDGTVRQDVLDLYSKSGVEKLVDVDLVAHRFSSLVLMARFDPLEPGQEDSARAVVYHGTRYSLAELFLKSTAQVAHAIDQRFQAIVAAMQPGFKPVEHFASSRGVTAAPPSTVYVVAPRMEVALVDGSGGALVPPPPPPPPVPRKRALAKSAAAAAAQGEPKPKTSKVDLEAQDNPKVCVEDSIGAHPAYHFKQASKGCPFYRWSSLKEGKFPGEFADKCKRLPRAAGDKSNEAPSARDQRVWLDSGTGLRARFLAEPNFFGSAMASAEGPGVTMVQAPAGAADVV